ncbi:MAG: DUF1501 domain-containing protein, partial [Gemmataceae bacterium]|nr:DUF1501 domain-containing protein [Gemmataceae bacterium]
MFRPDPHDRRHFLRTAGGGFGAVALAALLAEEGKFAADDAADPLAPKKPHFAPKAKAMISLYMVGGPSHIDLFDYKPELVKLDGQPFPGKVKYDNPAQASTRVQ